MLLFDLPLPNYNLYVLICYSPTITYIIWSMTPHSITYIIWSVTPQSPQRLRLWSSVKTTRSKQYATQMTKFSWWRRPTMGGWGWESVWEKMLVTYWDARKTHWEWWILVVEGGRAVRWVWLTLNSRSSPRAPQKLPGIWKCPTAVSLVSGWCLWWVGGVCGWFWCLRRCLWWAYDVLEGLWLWMKCCKWEILSLKGENKVSKCYIWSFK